MNKILARAARRLLLLVLPIASIGLAGIGCKTPPTETDARMTGLESMCASTADARSARSARQALYERLGGYDRILELTTEIVRLHHLNRDFDRFMPMVDDARLAKQVADFMAAGTGGDEEYEGLSLPESHRHLKLSDADFLSAGNDVMKAMGNLGYGQDETEEVVCLLVSLKDQVLQESLSQ